MPENNQSLANTTSAPSGLSVPVGSVSPAIADKIVTAIEGRFRDWLMHGEHEEAKQLVAEMLERELDGWTVQSKDYDRLALAARELRSACKDRLAVGHYFKLDEECHAIDAILSPNNLADPSGGGVSQKSQ